MPGTLPDYTLQPAAGGGVCSATPKHTHVTISVRKIVHIDMDAFYASVEQRDDPDLRGRPVAVGGSGTRGVVAAASYEARIYGVRSAMPSARARRMCPDLIFIKPRFEVYKSVSRQIRTIFARYTHLVEPLSLDEAYLDLTDVELAASSVVDAARRIKEEIRVETRLTASAGVSYNKFLSKMASDVDKPDGLFEIPREAAEAFLAELPIEAFHGIGQATATRMKELGIYTGADLRTRTEEELVQRFGKIGRFFYQIVRGEDHRPVRTERVRKSVGAERTFARDLSQLGEMEARLSEIAEKVARRMAHVGAVGRTVTLKIKYTDFSVTTRSTTFHRDIQYPVDLTKTACRLLHQSPPEQPVRLLGLTVSNLHPGARGGGGGQLTLSLES